MPAQEKSLLQRIEEQEKELKTRVKARVQANRKSAPEYGLLQRVERLEARDAEHHARARANRDPTRPYGLLQRITELEEREKELHPRDITNTRNRTAAGLEASKTTLREYLQLCHTHLSDHVFAQANDFISTQGGGYTANPIHKTRPNHLASWNTLIAQQAFVIERLLDSYPLQHPHVFESQEFIKTLGERVAARHISGKPDIYSFLWDAIEAPVAFILKHLHDLPDVSQEFRLASRNTNNYPFNSTKLKPDECHIYTSIDGNRIGGNRLDGDRRLAFIIEHHSPLKLTLPILRRGLRDMALDDVIRRRFVPHSLDRDALFQYHADRVVAAIVTQTFSYMTQNSVPYGCITTGEALVFLQISTEDPGVVRYRLAEPKADVEGQRKECPDSQDFMFRTAAGQVLAFSLMALETAPFHRHRHIDANLATWDVEPNDILDQVPKECRESPPHTEYTVETYDWCCWAKPTRFVEDLDKLPTKAASANYRELALARSG
ncbi:MAG: hypothetical protein M1840_000451 [Geoglossum simile]|nr:MAG: hypothetical protein M1840_000451 [Geoglossum simile]